MDIENTLLHADCFDIFPKLHDEIFDSIIDDPPYNINRPDKITFKSGKPVKTSLWGDKFDDTYTIDEFMRFLMTLAKEYFRLLKDGGNLLLFYDHNYPIYLIPFYKLFKCMNKILFIKTNPSPHQRKTGYRSGYEECFWFVKGDKPKTFNFKSQEDMINVYFGSNSQKVTAHPTEKYRWMIEPLILNHTNSGELIASFFAGSGSILAWSKFYDRKYFGTEINLEFYNIARQYINTVSDNNISLF